LLWSVHSEYDEAILTEHAEQMANAIPDAELLILDKVSHFASFQAPDRYTDASKTKRPSSLGKLIAQQPRLS